MSKTDRNEKVDMPRVSKSLLLDNYLTRKHNPHQRNSVLVPTPDPLFAKSDETKMTKPKIE
jgi:hypothetical protein